MEKETAIKVLKELHDKSLFAERTALETLIPELAESEDERIRKFLHHTFTAQYLAKDKLGKWHGEPVANILAWLEKQGGKDKLIQELGEYKVKYTQEVLEKHINSMNNKENERLRKTTIEFLKDYAEKGYENAVECIDWLEKQGEPTDINPSEFDLHLNKLLKQFETLPKEEIASSLGFYLNVVQNDGTYKPDEKQGEQKPADNFKPKFKVGDWVTNGLCAWRINSIDEDMYYTNHCGIDCGGDIKSIDEEYHIWTIQDAKDGDVLAEDTCTFIIKKLNHDLTAEIYCCLYDDGDFEFNSNLGFDDTCTYPATKEQRDLLFQKMKESGYKWDAEKKELRKIEQKSAKWNEEDETNSYHLKTLLENLAKDNKHEFRVISENDRDKYTAWLKSLKDRCTWKPSDEQIAALADALSLAKSCGEERAFDLRTLYEQLKKLKGE